MAKQPKAVDWRLPASLAVQLRWLRGDGVTVPQWLQQVVRDYMHHSGIAEGGSLTFSPIQAINEAEGEYRVAVRFTPAMLYLDATETNRQAARQLLIHAIRFFSRDSDRVDEYYALNPSERMTYLTDRSSASSWVISERSAVEPRMHGVGRLVRVTPGQPLAPHLRRAV